MLPLEFERNLNRYADLAVEVGVNIQPGQRLLIWSSIEFAPLVEKVAVRAYQRGARLVETLWNDPQLLLARFEYAPRDSFDEVSTWWAKAGLEYAEQGDAVLSIRGTDPDLLRDQDSALISTHRKAEGRVSEPYYRLVSAGAMNWCVIAHPVHAWAAKVYPDVTPDEQEAHLWEAIFDICRVTTPDPIAAWKEQAATLHARCDYLNEKRYTALHFTGPGTDLVVGLPEQHRWMGGGATSANGIDHIPNLPTEEVFTAPHRARVDGVVSASLPLNYNGSLIEGFTLSFTDGRVTDVSAARGEALLRSIIETDEGASRLGELALVPQSSPIAQSGRLFYNTLYDENAASHVALGRAYRACIDGSKELTEAEFADLGGNSSVVHVDFMIGAPTTDVDGILADGTPEPLMRQGNFVE